MRAVTHADDPGRAALFWSDQMRAAPTPVAACDGCDHLFAVDALTDGLCHDCQIAEGLEEE